MKKQDLKVGDLVRVEVTNPDKETVSFTSTIEKIKSKGVLINNGIYCDFKFIKSATQSPIPSK